MLNAVAPLVEKDKEQDRDRDQIAQLIERVIASNQSVEIRFAQDSVDINEPIEMIVIPWSPETFRRKRDILQPADGVTSAARSIRIEARTKSYAESNQSADVAFASDFGE